MALIKCPECNRDVSDSASTCPLCGFELSKNAVFSDNRIMPLSTPFVEKANQKQGIIKMFWGIGLIISGFFTVSFFVGYLLIVLGIAIFLLGRDNRKDYRQTGNCPYCNTQLIVKTGNTSFRCPVCNNYGKQTESTLETTH